MKEGLGDEVDCIDKTIVRDSKLTLVPRTIEHSNADPGLSIPCACPVSRQPHTSTSKA